MTAHELRIRDALRAFDEANGRLSAILASIPRERAEQAPPGGWSAAQIAWHVAAVTDALARLISGEAPGSRPARPDFVERPWSELAAAIPEKMTSPELFQPPGDVGRDAAVERLAASGARLHGAMAALTPERASHTCRLPWFVASLYQAGEFAGVHAARHCAQAARLAG
jgi:hypothetical protein